MIIFISEMFNSTPRHIVDRLQEHVSCRHVHTTLRRRIRTSHDDIVVNWGIHKPIPTVRECRILNEHLISSKYQQALRFVESGLRIPATALDTYNIRSVGPGENQVLSKPVHGHGGSGISMVSSNSRAREGYFYQKYIPKIAEFRVHVCGKHGVSWIRKKPEDESAITWNSNHAVQHTFKNHIVRKALENLAVDACAALSYDFGAVDIIMDKYGTLYLLEVNSAPALTVDERVNAYVDYFREL